MTSAEPSSQNTREQVVAAMTPPPEKNFVGLGDFASIGNDLLEKLKAAGLQPHHRVLDVGCGIGRMAIPLTGYLDQQGAYEGFDIREDGIQWCQEKITPHYPQFHFKHTSLQNTQYLPEATSQAEKFHFPYPSRSFDFVFLTSVFTHVSAAVVCNYLEEINRVLKKNGRMFATFFLFAQGAPRRSKGTTEPVFFPHEFGHYRLMELNNPAFAIAYDEAWVTAQCEQRGLQIRWPIQRGFQDAVVAEKKRSLPLSRRWRRLKRRLGLSSKRSVAEGIGKKDSKPKKSSPKPSMPLQVMWPQNGSYSPRAMAVAYYPTDQWIQLALGVPPQLPGAVLRVDPCEAPGSLWLTSMRLSPAGDQERGFHFQKFEDMTGLKVDSLELLPESRCISFLSQGKDPKIYLPPLTKELSGVRLQLEVWVRFERQPKQPSNTSAASK